MLASDMSVLFEMKFFKVVLQIFVMATMEIAVWL